MNTRIITVAGSLGSGKSSTAKGVATKLGYRHFSSGDLFRSIAAERGISILEINKQAELEHQIDHAVDERLQAMANDENFVIDSRLAYHWMPKSFKVYLSLDPRTAADRIYKQIQNKGRVSEDTKTVEEVYETVIERQASEQKRYLNLYQIDPLDLTPFDLVIDTARKPLDTVIKQILEEYELWLNASS